MIKKYTLLFAIILLHFLKAGAQCTQCTPVNCASVKPNGGLCNKAPDDTVAHAYNATISFYMPRILKDSATLSQCYSCSYVELHQIKITGIQGLPVGLSGTPNHSNGTYDVWGGDTTGCVQFCGTPLTPGTYYITVNLSADVKAINSSFGDVSQSGVAQTYKDTIVIYPSNSVCPQTFTTGSTPCVTKACDSLSVNLNATLVNANCPNLISYKWNLGNSQTSTLKQPGIVNYNVPDTFTLRLTTTYYTYRLKSVYVKLLQNYYGDIEEGNASVTPDPYIMIPTLGYNGSAAYVSNVFSATFSNLNLSIPLNNCANAVDIQAWDYDPISQNDSCGVHHIIPSVPGPVYDSTSWSVVSALFDTVAVTSVTDSMNIIVAPHPPVPVITVAHDTLCANDTATLRLNQSLQGYYFTWYKDSADLGLTDSVIRVTASGNYQVRITNALTACEEWSAVQAVTFMAMPASGISIVFTGTQEFLNPSPSQGFGVNWYYNGNLVAGETGHNLPFLGNGTYTADIYNSAFPGCKTSATPKVVSGMDEVDDTWVNDLRIFPNPNNGRFKVEFFARQSGSLKLNVADAVGRNMYEKLLDNFNGQYNDEIDLSDLPKGMYFVVIESETARKSAKIMIQ